MLPFMLFNSDVRNISLNKKNRFNAKNDYHNESCQFSVGGHMTLTDKSYPLQKLFLIQKKKKMWDDKL